MGAAQGGVCAAGGADLVEEIQKSALAGEVVGIDGQVELAHVFSGATERRLGDNFSCCYDLCQSLLL